MGPADCSTTVLFESTTGNAHLSRVTAIERECSGLGASHCSMKADEDDECRRRAMEGEEA
jgi:hypothetical protein